MNVIELGRGENGEFDMRFHVDVRSTGSARKVLAMHHPIFANPGRRNNSLSSPFLHASVR